MRIVAGTRDRERTKKDLLKKKIFFLPEKRSKTANKTMSAY
ncbi:MAG: hypothetical protein US34_C0023G0005 [Candidatus Nomurabacteria bacterium GW2011_GWC2_36_9]|uniref:Uncharacterized protein n=1 Tax=candidate division WS6 bacterium GW2011_GWF1_36_8 TaxID=1619098 RepID=A0A0G0FNJ9_9BACT|nr:MAG: hypothetical protein US29_C0045G0002 [candidate division WS6 bacterium GW2011_GWF1_36_8]KKQ19331.1 MAG: hypothetical protein US34_C0023G0005 [Candidatus Nomurabacteria bacterium GW2011_GWC2_36_9]